MWRYSAKNDYPNISLHDCRMVKVTAEGKDILCEFDNGFWLVENNIQNPFDKTLRTGKAQVRFTNCDFDFTHFFIFKTFYIFNKPIFTRRIELSLEDFCKKINIKKWEFEFIDELYAWRRAVFNGEVWFNRKPYRMECTIQLFYEDMLYFWDVICEDKIW